MTTSFKSWTIALVGGLFFFYNFIQMTLFNPLAQSIMETFSIGEVAFGGINSGYFLAVALLALPGGMIVDKVRSKTLLLILTIATVINLFIIASIKDAGLLGILRFAQGMIHAFALILPLKLAMQWVAPKNMAMASSLIVTIGLLGGALAQPVLTYYVDTVGLHQALFNNAYLGMAIVAIFALVIRDNEAFWQAHQSTGSFSEYLSGLRVSVFNLQNWIGGLYVCLLNLPIILLGASWGQPYMEHTWGLSAETGSFVISLIFIGMIVGGPLMGFLSDAMGSRKGPMLAGSVLSILVLGAILLSPTLDALKLGVLFLLLGIMNSSQVLVYPMVTETNHPRYIGTSLSIVTLVLMAGNALANVLFSALLRQNTVQTAWGPEYTSSTFTPGMWMIWAALVFSLVVIWMMRENRDC